MTKVPRNYFSKDLFCQPYSDIYEEDLLGRLSGELINAFFMYYFAESNGLQARFLTKKKKEEENSNQPKGAQIWGSIKRKVLSEGMASIKCNLE